MTLNFNGMAIRQYAVAMDSQSKQGVYTMAWQDKVKEAMAQESLAAYRQAGNKPGKPHKRYSLPDIVMALRDALNRDDEAEGKRLLVIWRTGAVSLI